MKQTAKEIALRIDLQLEEIDKRRRLALELLDFIERNHMTHAEKSGLLKFVANQLEFVEYARKCIAQVTSMLEHETFASEPEDLPF